MINVIIRNLLNNAIKFTKNGGTVSVSSKTKNNFTEISIKDTGIGISKENINKLFRTDVHHTTIGTSEEKGTGLGLILCKEFVEKNNGKIWVESDLNKGSTFTFSLPNKLQ